MKRSLKVYIATACSAVILIAFVLATFFDYQISEAIARLSAGKYISDSKFGKFFEVVGESPMYLVGCFAAACLTRGCFLIKNKYLKITLACVCLILGVFASTLMLQRATEYVYEQKGILDRFEELKTLITAGFAVLSIGLMALTCYFTFQIPEKHMKGLVVFSIAVILMIALSQGLVQGVKVIVGRQRFRAIKVLEYHGLNHLIDYTKWFEINGKRVVSEEMLALGIATDGYKSFPSGHTCSWSMVFALTVIPDFLAIDEKKRVKIKGILLVATTLSVMLLGYTRILVGAHYLTDVMFAAVWTYFTVIISKHICKKLIKIK